MSAVTADELMWTDKYRPDTLADIRGNDAVVSRLESWVSDERAPNVLLSGPAGTGKTSAAIAFAKDKYGTEWQNHFLQLNASDDRGIETVREDIKEFARLSTVSDYQWKIVFLDESDHLTRSAQPALRRVMEDYSDVTRFILSCNYPNKLIDPIQSRCATLRMSRLDSETVQGMLEEVACSEGLDYATEQLDRIIRKADGDTRSAIHMLQSATVDGSVDDTALDALMSYPSEDEVREIFDMAVAGDHEAMEMIDDLISRGVDEQAILDEILSVVKQSNDIPADAKMKLMDKIAETEWRIVRGSNPQIQLNALVANIRVARYLSLAPYQQAQQQSE